MDDLNLIGKLNFPIFELGPWLYQIIGSIDNIVAD